MTELNVLFEEITSTNGFNERVRKCYSSAYMTGDAKIAPKVLKMTNELITEATNLILPTTIIEHQNDQKWYIEAISKLNINTVKFCNTYNELYNNKYDFRTEDLINKITDLISVL